MPGNGFYHLYAFLWSNVSYSPSSQTPQPGVYKSKLFAQCLQIDQDSYHISIQPSLTLANTLTSTSLLFRQHWDYLNLTPVSGNPYFQFEHGLSLGPGVVSTWIQDYLLAFLDSIVLTPPTGTEWRVQFFVPISPMKTDVKDDNDQSLIRGVCVLYPVAIEGNPWLTSGDVYYILIQDPKRLRLSVNSIKAIVGAVSTVAGVAAAFTPLAPLAPVLVNSGVGMMATAGVNQAIGVGTEQMTVF